MNINKPIVYVPTAKELTRMGFVREETITWNGYWVWYLVLANDHITISYSETPGYWSVDDGLTSSWQITFWPRNELELKIVLRCLIKPSTTIV